MICFYCHNAVNIVNLFKSYWLKEKTRLNRGRGMLERLQFRFFRRAGVIVVQTSLYGAGLAPTPEKVPTLKPCFLCGTGRLSVSSGSRETCAAENQRDRKVTQYKSIVNLNHAARDFFCSCLSERYLHRAAAGSFRDSHVVFVLPELPLIVPSNCKWCLTDTRVMRRSAIIGPLCGKWDVNVGFPLHQKESVFSKWS